MTASRVEDGQGCGQATPAAEQIRVAEAAEVVTQTLEYRYHLKDEHGTERQVTMDEWVTAERLAGFHSTTGHYDQPATAYWSSTTGGRPDAVSGRIEYVLPVIHGHYHLPFTSAAHDLGYGPVTVSQLNMDGCDDNCRVLNVKTMEFEDVS